MRNTHTLLLLALAPVVSYGQSPTWADDVACIFFSHCTNCHNANGVSGELLDLTDFSQAQAHRNDIRDWTQAGYMPPWPPDQSYRRLAHERVLSQSEIDIIAAWANAGGPQGNPNDAPPVPVYNSIAEIAAPNITAIMNDYMVPPSSVDLYRCFVLPIDNPSDNFIKRLEVIPGNREIVHHVLVYQDTTGQAQVLDDADTDPGYTSFGGIGVDNAPLVGIWVPGSPVLSTPLGMGIKLFAGADLVIQVHYPAMGSPQLDSTRVNVEFSFEPLTREIGIVPALDHLITITDGPLIIPPNEVKTFHAQLTLPIPATITAIGPHAHLLCTDMQAWAITPDQDSVPLIHIPRWDFHWQGMYQFRNPLYLPIGTVLHGQATYDNTAANESNPNDPPAWVFLGEGTTDEMMLFYFAYTFGFPSDTLIVVDDNEHPEHYLECTTDFNIGVHETAEVTAVIMAPNPAGQMVSVQLTETNGTLRLFDLQGRELLRQRLSAGTNTIDVTGLSRGSIITEVRDGSGLTLHRSPLLLQ